MNNARLWMAARRAPMPRNAVTGVVDAFDRCDPTRSHESKPSARMREARYTRRMWRALFRFALAVVLLAALLSLFN